MCENSSEISHQIISASKLLLNNIFYILLVIQMRLSSAQYAFSLSHKLHYFINYYLQY